MLIEDLLKKIEIRLPAHSAMDGDRIGLQVQSGRTEVRKIFVTLELNDEVAEEAAQNCCDCIITFHPLIYSPLISITDSNRTGRILQKIIKQNQALISIHTNFDAFIEGTSKIFAGKLNLIVDGFLKPDDNISNCGMGIIANSESKLNENDILERIASVCKSPLRWTSGKKKEIHRIAIVGGSGFSFIQDVIDSGADAFITADVSYHKFHEVFSKIMLIDPGHYEMEQFVPVGLANLLKETLNQSEYDSIEVSEIVTNPVKYYPETEKYIQLQKKLIFDNKIR